MYYTSKHQHTPRHAKMMRRASRVLLVTFAMAAIAQAAASHLDDGGRAAGSMKVQMRRLAAKPQLTKRGDQFIGSKDKKKTTGQKRLDARPKNEARDVGDDTLYSSSSIIAPIQIGTPPQNLWVLLDTASSDLAVFDDDYGAQYRPTKDAAQTKVGPPFQSSKSSTYKASAETFTNNYGSGDTASFFTAVRSRDTVAFESLILQAQPLGVIHHGDVSYGPKAAGIMGLAFEGASSGLQATPVVEQLYFSGSLKQPVFTFALARPSTVAELTSQDDITQPGGIFTLGIVDTEQYEGKVGWSSVVSTDTSTTVPGKWLAKIDSIQINGKTIPQLKGAVANFDTGSSASRTSASLMDTLISHVPHSFKDGAGNYYVPCGIKQPPSMTMSVSMGGVTVEIEPLDLLYKTEQYTIEGTEATYCATTLSTTESHDYDLQLGDDVMRSLFVAFQFAPPRIGIAAQSAAVRGEAAAATYAFQGPPTALDAESLYTVTPPSASTMQPVAAEPANTAAPIKHLGENKDGEALMAGGLLVKGVTATMEKAIASSSAPMETRSMDDTAGAAATNDANSSGVDTDGLNISPTASGASVSAAQRPAAPVYGATAAVLTMLAGALVASLSLL